MFLNVYSFLNRFARCGLDEVSKMEKEKGDENSGASVGVHLKMNISFSFTSVRGN